MNRVRVLLILLASLILTSTSAYAQKATIFQLANGQYIGIAYMPSGVVLLTEVTVIKIADPTPPPPQPPVGENPFPAGQGLRLLILYEKDDQGTPRMTRAQELILSSGSIRSYLNSHCLKGPDGRADFRVWDDDKTAFTDEPEYWQKVFAHQKGKVVPRYLISNGTSWEEGALPANETDFLTLLRKYGGN